jgi:hypothetical protein
MLAFLNNPRLGWRELLTTKRQQRAAAGAGIAPNYSLRV